MLNQNQDKLKIFRDNIGNLVIETVDGAFVAIPLVKDLTATAASAANSITKGSAVLEETSTAVVKATAMVGLGATAIVALGGFVGAIMGATALGVANNMAKNHVVTGLSPSTFLIQIQKELSNTGYIYLKLGIGDKKAEPELASYVAIPAILISDKEKIYKLVLDKKTTQKQRNIFKKVITSFQNSYNWLLDSDIPTETEEISYFLLAKNSKKSLAKIKVKSLISKTFEKAFTGDYSGE